MLISFVTSTSLTSASQPGAEVTSSFLASNVGLTARILSHSKGLVAQLPLRSIGSLAPIDVFA